MGLRSVLVAGVAFGSSLVHAASSFSPARPPAIPLAVKGPYLNSWLHVGSDGGNGGYLAGEWPVFWSQQITGWAGFIRVDGKAYNWLGAPPGADLVDQTEFSYTSTRSSFVMSVGGKVEMNITFLTPVTPNDLKRQSLVFSYLDVAVSSLDGASHDVQLYADVSAEWASGDGNAIIEWDHNSADGVAYHQFARQNQQAISETNQQANWGTWFWSTKDVEGLTWQSAADTVVRNAFINNGVLPNTKDSNYRAVTDNWPVFGFANDLGSVGTDAVSTLYSIGMTQDGAINLLGEGSDLTTYPALWNSYFGSDIDAMTFFYNDYEESASIATDLDNQVASDSIAAAGQNYLTLTSLSVRQTFGALQFTGTDSDPLVFLKEISSNSDIQTVDVIFPAMPLILYTNPAILNYMLKPLFLNQENGHYPNTNAIHDLGTFPVAKGYTDGSDEPMPLEECGNMIIMVLAYAQKTGDNDYLKQHYPILKQWAGYLVDEALIPADQISTDDFAGSLANQTNLGLKGIIGLRAMSEISSLTGNTDDASSYLNTATSYISQWQGFGLNTAADPPHATLSYGEADSHGLLYNLYSNSLLNFGDFVPQSVYDMQSNFYPTVALEYGIPLDTRHTYTKTDWMMWCAAIASADTRDTFIKLIAGWIDSTPTNMALTDLYDASSGNYPSGLQFTARPVVGGHFSLLALPS
ncbi:glutaminase A [Annulohypoxylon maeteangense]|uniref:glutaminase A n=1 Tax=Annulohypoxylon maeteangense TaxID=1927788 RepID=UPI002007AC97|nr:glutaminase A [Annulohypoxylon maeteangense]KAI0881842.1 glutaminase A [Annulohypoxylon maeteangense]